ncbi:MAG: hypothetical protein RJP95_02905, partial [Pirellulales bacterium]
MHTSDLPATQLDNTGVAWHGLPQIAGEFHPRAWIPARGEQPGVHVRDDSLAVAQSTALRSLVAPKYRHFAQFEMYRQHGWHIHWLHEAGYPPWQMPLGANERHPAERLLRLAFCCISPFWSPPSDKFWYCKDQLLCPFCWTRERVEPAYRRFTAITRSRCLEIRIIGTEERTKASSVEEIYNHLLPKLRKEARKTESSSLLGRYLYHWISPDWSGGNPVDPADRGWILSTKGLHVFPRHSKASRNVPHSVTTIDWPWTRSRLGLWRRQ